MTTMTGQAGEAAYLLPVKILPYPNESCSGFIMRIAAANGYPSPRWIIELCTVLSNPQGRGMREQVANAFKDLMGLTWAETEFLERSILVERHLSGVHYSRKLRMCPECVKENKYLDYMWEVSFASACPYHGIQLIDYCPECMSKLSWDSISIEACKCGADLTQISTTAADDITLYYNRKMWAAMGRDVTEDNMSGLPDKIFSEYSLDDLCNVFRFLFRAAIKTPVRANSKPKNVTDAIHVFHLIHPLLSEWPHGLYRFLDSYKDKNGYFRGEGLHQAFGVFHRGLYSYPRQSYDFIKVAYEEYIKNNWPGVIDRRYKGSEIHKNSKYTILRKASEQLKTSRVRLNKLIGLGIIPGCVKQRASGRHFTILKKCVLSRFAREKKHMINKSETRKKMGISKSHFDIFVKSKIINPFIKAGDHGFAEWWCDDREIEKIMAKIRAMTPEIEPSENAIPLSQICQSHLTNTKYFPILIRSVMNGQVKVAGRKLDSVSGTFKLSSIYFEQKEIEIFRKATKAKLRDSQIFSIPEASVMLGIKQEVAYHLVNNSFLKCHVDSAGLRRGRVIWLNDITEFEKTYMPLVEIARLNNLCPRTQMEELKKLGINPVVGGSADGCRQVFYQRNIVLDWYV